MRHYAGTPTHLNLACIRAISSTLRVALPRSPSGLTGLHCLGPLHRIGIQGCTIGGTLCRMAEGFTSVVLLEVRYTASPTFSLGLYCWRSPVLYIPLPPSLTRLPLFSGTDGLLYYLYYY
ncbi:hypothetical protein Zmor_023422 [Zophobas morio]|uniref:Uncharacterized protein n=1 Tax=Zophobas morio TaxID=2755281 RepID=A0AA38HWZ6_9CUCU|nr:hypothetical protein Zmor_023422 [Zophobas morio]